MVGKSVQINQTDIANCVLRDFDDYDEMFAFSLRYKQL